MSLSKQRSIFIMFKKKLSIFVSLSIFSCSVMQYASQQTSSRVLFHNNKPTALHEAALTNDLEAVRRILQRADIDINVCDQYGTTPLHCLVDRLLEGKEVSNPLLEIMIDADADITIISEHQKYSDTKTPWEMAIKSGDLVAISIILDKVNQQNIVLKDKKGLTPKQVAEKFRQTRVIECFEGSQFCY